MRDYLTSLAARSLEPAPAIQPRLASLFEPLGLVGPVFSRTGRVAHRFETIATADGAAPEVLTQSRADPDPAERAIPPMPASSLKIANQSADWASRDAPPPVSDQQRKPVATTVHLAEPESLSSRETEDIESRDQIVSRSRPPEEGPAKVVVPVIDVAVSGENSHRDEPRPP